MSASVLEESGGAALRRLHASVVPTEEIDQLGHMNVRFYGVRAMAASQKLAEDLSLTPGAAGSRLVFTDLFTRWFREQLEGAKLEVWGGVLDVSDTHVRMYQELINADSGELSATFVHVLQLQDPHTREPVPFTSELIDACRRAQVAWPEHGRPRSINLERLSTTLTLEEAHSRGLSARPARTIEADECGPEGYFDAKHFFDLVWGRDMADDEEGDWLEDFDGGKFGWASVESRGTLLRLPRAGDRIQSFGAVVGIGPKTRHEKFWVFDLERGDVLCTAQIVNVAFDVGARKALVIPEKQRKELEQRYHPDLV